MTFFQFILFILGQLHSVHPIFGILQKALAEGHRFRLWSTATDIQVERNAKGVIVLVSLQSLNDKCFVSYTESLQRGQKQQSFQVLFQGHRQKQKNTRLDVTLCDGKIVYFVVDNDGNGRRLVTKNDLAVVDSFLTAMRDLIKASLTR